MCIDFAVDLLPLDKIVIKRNLLYGQHAYVLYAKIFFQ